MSCSQVQGRVLLWNSVLRCSCNSSELYLPLFFISPTMHLCYWFGIFSLPTVHNSQKKHFFLLAKSLGPIVLFPAFWPQLGQPHWTQCVWTSTRGMVTIQLSFLPEISFLQWRGLQWPSKWTWARWQGDLVRAVSLSCSSSECPAMRTHLSLLLGCTQLVEETWDSPCLCWT